MKNETDKEPKLKAMTVGYQFSNDIFISPDLLDKCGVKYTDEDLEDCPWGKVLRIRDIDGKKDN